MGASNNCLIVFHTFVDMAEFGRKTSLHPATTGQKYGKVCLHSTGQQATVYYDNLESGGYFLPDVHVCECSGLGQWSWQS